jgi:hypothetical protein
MDHTWNVVFPVPCRQFGHQSPENSGNLGSSHMLVYVYHVSETAVVSGLRELIPVIKSGIGLMQIENHAN